MLFNVNYANYFGEDGGQGVMWMMRVMVMIRVMVVMKRMIMGLLMMKKSTCIEKNIDVSVTVNDDGDSGDFGENGEIDDDDDDGDSDYAPSDDLLSLHSSDDEDHRSFPSFIPERDVNDPTFKLGMLFASSDDFRNACREYSIMNKKDIKLRPNEKWRIRAKCKLPCPWVVFASKYDDNETLQIKSFNDVHSNCRPAYKNRNVTAKWLAKRYMENFKNNPQWPVEAIRETDKSDHTVGVSKSKVYRAKRTAKTLINGTHQEQYALIWNYCLEIKRAMPGSTLVVHKGG